MRALGKPRIDIYVNKLKPEVICQIVALQHMIALSPGTGFVWDPPEINENCHKSMCLLFLK